MFWQSMFWKQPIQSTLHCLIWMYVCQQNDLEKMDPRGRTPLHLAVTLGHIESTKVLLRHGANANAENKKYWTGVWAFLFNISLGFFGSSMF